VNVGGTKAVGDNVGVMLGLEVAEAVAVLVVVPVAVIVGVCVT
jgi:hypothetical protein